MTEKMWKERRLYYYYCKGCSKRRTSLKRSKAREGMCRVCKRREIQDNQPGLFGDSIFSQTIEKMSKAAGNILGADND